MVFLNSTLYNIYMQHFISSSLGWFRIMAFLEGTSYIVLLLIAMPLKYLADIPEAVKYTGWAHGVFFILYMVQLGELSLSKKWNLNRIAIVFIAALVPAGTFVLDAKLLKRLHEKEIAQ